MTVDHAEHEAAGSQPAAFFIPAASPVAGELGDESRMSNLMPHIPSTRCRGAIGVLREANKYLLVQRAEGLTKGGTWCFPGGHLEPGENSRAALVRELHEELGISVVPKQRLGVVRVPDSKYVLATWLIDYDGAPLNPDAAEIADAKWLTIAQIRSHPFGLPTNEKVLHLLEKCRA